MKIKIIESIYENHCGDTVTGLYKVEISDSCRRSEINYIARTDGNIGILTHFVGELPDILRVTESAKEEFLKALKEN